LVETYIIVIQFDIVPYCLAISNVVTVETVGMRPTNEWMLIQLKNKKIKHESAKSITFQFGSTI